MKALPKEYFMDTLVRYPLLQLAMLCTIGLITLKGEVDYYCAMGTWPVTVWAIVEQSFLKYKSFERRLGLSLGMGTFSAITVSLAGRVAMVINYLVASPDRHLTGLIYIFLDSWWLHVGLALFGMLCMSVKPLLRAMK